MRLILLLPFLVLLCACQEQDDDRPSVDPSVFQDAEAACTRDGGRWIARGQSTLKVCQRTPQDAGDRCTSSRDCEGLCLARSGTCAPVVPLFGCNEVLGSNGTRSTVCVD